MSSEQKDTKYFIFLDNSGSMKSYYTNVKNNLHQMFDLSINPTILTFGNFTKELYGSNFQEKLINYHTTNDNTYMSGVVERFVNYLSDAPNGQKICILFITDGRVFDLEKITPFLLTCVDIIINKKLAVYMSCVAINSSADMKTFSLLGLLNNFSVFQLIQSKDGNNWGEQVVYRFKEIETCETSVYSSTPDDFIYSDIVVDSKICEQGPYNKVYLATLVQAFTICNFNSFQEEGFMMCKKLLKYIADLGISEKTRYIWSKLNTAKMISDKDSNVIAHEFISTINDCKVTIAEPTDKQPPTDKQLPVNREDQNISITNEHNVRVRLFVGKTKNFTECLPITINAQNQITIQSDGLNELYLNVEVYHPSESVDLEISYGINSTHKWYIPYGVSLIEGDVKYLMLAHEKLKPSNVSHEKTFDFIIKAVPSSLTTQTQSLTTFAENVPSSIDDTDTPAILFSDMEIRRHKRSRRFSRRTKTDSTETDGMTDLTNEEGVRDFVIHKPSTSANEEGSRNKIVAKAFVTISKETRKIDTVKRERQINPNAHVLCFSFAFVYDSDSFESERLSLPQSQQIIYITEECVICLDHKPPTIKFKCTHQCICSECYVAYVAYIKANQDLNLICPLCRQHI